MLSLQPTGPGSKAAFELAVAQVLALPLNLPSLLEKYVYCCTAQKSCQYSFPMSEARSIIRLLKTLKRKHLKITLD